MSHQVQISLLKSTSITEIEATPNLSINDLAEAVLRENWCPATFNDNYRTIANAKKTDLFVMDVDSGCTIAEAKEHFKEYWHIIGTSKSHQLEKTTKGGTVYPACDRFRVILLLDEPVTTDLDFKKTFKHLQDTFGFMDEACKDISRFFYPCKEIVSVNDDILGTVRDCSADPDPDGREIKISTEAVALQHKGRMFAASMDFFLRGAPHGERNTRLFQALSNAKEQGYSMEESIELVRDCGLKNDIESFYPEIAQKHIATFQRVYSRPSTNPVQYETIAEAKQNPYSKENLIKDMLEYLNDDGATKGIATGITGLDALLGGGLRMGEVTVLHGEAKSGKTTLYHKIQHNLFHRGIAQGYAPRESKASRHAFPHYVALQYKQNPKVNPFWKEDIPGITSYLGALPIDIMPGLGQAPWEETKDWMDKCIFNGIKIFWFDHLHYLVGLGADYQKVAEYFGAMKIFAEERRVHINIIVQAVTLGKDDRIGTNTIRGGNSIMTTLDNLLIYTASQPPGQTAPIPNCRRIKVIGRDDLVTQGEMYLQYQSNTRDIVECRVVETPQEPDRQRVSAMRNYQENVQRIDMNKYLIT